MKYFSPFHFLMLISLVAAVHGQVLDRDGDPLIPGDPYYVLPTGHTIGGLDLNWWQPNCPLAVVQATYPVSWGTPVRFHPLAPGLKIVPESDNLYVDFIIPTIDICQTTSVWTVDDSSPLGIVKTGGNGTESSSWFRIEKTEFGTGYKFVYNPTEKELCRPLCVDVGIRTARWVSYLAVGGPNLEVVFVKYSDKGSVAADQ